VRLPVLRTVPAMAAVMDRRSDRAAEGDRADPSVGGAHRTLVILKRCNVVLGVVVLIAVAGIFCATPDGTGFLQGMDSWFSGMLRIGALRPTATWRTAYSPPVMLVIAAGAGLARPRRGGTARAVGRSIAATASAAVAARVAALIVSRPGPGHLGDLAAANATSFPSVPAAMLTALTVTTLVAIPSSAPRRRIVIVILLLAVAFRVIAGFSWSLDEVAGATLGVVVARSWGPLSAVRRTWRRRPRSVVAVLALTVVVGSGGVPVGVSYAHVLHLPGRATLDERTVEWLRSNHLGGFVDRAESWWLWHHLPSTTDMVHTLPTPAVTVRTTTEQRAELPPSLTPLVTSAIRNEGRWSVAAVDAGGHPEIATTAFRPDAAHPSVVASVAWINHRATRIALIAGTQQPGGGAGPAGAEVPASALPNVLAAFNSGYKMRDTPGGTLIEGRTTRSMVVGLATLAVRPDGTATVGAWGTDISVADGYVGLRQNLHLMVHDGRPVPGVSTNAHGLWGTVRNTLPTWRSGLGVTKDGDLVYVAGDHLTLGVLADAMIHAGAVTAMELDIHRGMVSFNLFTHEPGLVGHRLSADMNAPANRYLTPDWRDFVMVTSR
jgi:hypothetical protein